MSTASPQTAAGTLSTAGSRGLLPFAQLVRLPNAFTAMADIGLGALAMGALPQQIATFVLVLLASTCLYCTGMVWNDYFDVEQDRRERPFRPLPSGRVTMRQALILGTVLMIAGLIFAALADWGADGLRWRSLWFAILLVAGIFLYDGWLKRTWAGPVGMGACRFLNVLLGLSVAAEPIASWGVLLAWVVGLYIVGVTWFARTEACESEQSMLALAAGLMVAAAILALGLPPAARTAGHSLTTSPLFPYLLVAFGFYVGAPVARAIARPAPSRVQAAVKRAVLGLVVFDAVLATALAGEIGLVLLVLLPPAMYLGRWLYST
jgi:4-hydroxybenzoate polyprenyltransferase